jgi:hypothetical protein
LWPSRWPPSPQLHGQLRTAIAAMLLCRVQFWGCHSVTHTCSLEPSSSKELTLLAQSTLSASSPSCSLTFVLPST